MKAFWQSCVFAVLLCGMSASFTFAEKPSVMTGTKIAIVGDSITEQKLYSRYMECYMLACSGIPNVKVFQFGWSGETANGFAARMENDLPVFKPDVITLCYGMNDGGYRPYAQEVGDNYEKNMRAVLAKLQTLGVKQVVVGSPGAVDTDFFRSGQKLGEQPAHVAYNDNLAHLRDIDKKLAEEQKHAFADVHAAMYNAMEKAKAELGKEYDVCGRDGFHPGPNGQLAMAYAFLKNLGLSGEIGTITLAMDGTATASTGHAVVSKKAGSVTIASTQWPYCFSGDAKSSNGTRSITKYLPFNEDLNRFTLKVNGLTAAKAKVTWGDATVECTKEQLAAGINLNALFSKTPFDASFDKLQDLVGKKQSFETYMIKQMITGFRLIPAELKNNAKFTAALDQVKTELMAHRETLEQEVRAALKPVEHTITVTPVQ